MLGQLIVQGANVIAQYRWGGMLLLASLWPSMSLAQHIYKWTDAAGTVHYSEQPPAGNAKVLQLADRDSRAPEDAVQETAKARADASAELDRAESAQRQRLCDKARSNFKRLDGPGLVLSGGDIDTATQMSEEQRHAARDEAKRQIAEYCDA